MCACECLYLCPCVMVDAVHFDDATALLLFVKVRRCASVRVLMRMCLCVTVDAVHFVDATALLLIVKVGCCACVRASVCPHALVSIMVEWNTFMNFMHQTPVSLPYQCAQLY